MLTKQNIPMNSNWKQLNVLLNAGKLLLKLQENWMLMSVSGNHLFSVSIKTEMGHYSLPSTQVPYKFYLQQHLLRKCLMHIYIH